MAVRKTVTVLFCDLVGSTALGDDADPEVLQERMARYHAELREVLERHGGTVEKFIGDAVMAVFGLPQAHEDDALRATRAALEVRDRADALGLRVRVGVNTGEVVAGDGETLVTGDAVNVAARLEQAAEAGEILVGEPTERLVREAARTESLEPLEVKGKAAPVHAYRLLELRPDLPAFTRRIDAPFVGREDELRALEAAFGTAAERREPQLATIVGPPGIGKSRLARELIQRSDARVLVGRCLSYGEGITYWPLQEIVQQVGDLDAALPDELARARVAAAVGEGSASPDEIAWGFRRLFEELARERPLIAVLDDVHWAEPTLLDLIEYVASFASDASLLLLCTARPDLFEVRSGWTTPKPNASLVALDPLPLDETRMLVDELRDLAPRAKTAIVEAAEGNPLFVEQLVAHHAEAGNGRLEIPPTIQALLSARIDRLDPAERAVIERASVEGRFFHRGSVQALLPEGEQGDVGGHLLALVRKELIRPDRSQFRGDDGFRFGHILIRDAAYESIPKRLRAELHERFAGWIEERMEERAPDEILGYHLEQSHRYRTELGVDDERTHELAVRASRRLAEAGRRAHARVDDGAVRALLGRALALMSDDDPERPELLLLLGASTALARDPSEGIELLRRAQEAAAALDQPRVALRARMRELGWLLESGPDESASAALAEAEAAIARLEELGDTEALLDAWWLVGAVGALRGDRALEEKACVERIELAFEVGSRRQARGATSHLIHALAEGATPVDEAIVRAEEARSRFRHEPPGDASLALLYAFGGRFEEAEQALRRQLRLTYEHGLELNHAASSMYTGWIALLAGEPERAEEDLRQGAAVLGAAGAYGWLSTVAAILAEVLYRLGRHDEAEERTRESERRAAVEDNLSQALWRATRAKAVARRGEADVAERLSEESVEYGERSGLPTLGDCLFDRAEVLRLLGRPREARAVFEEALAVYERKGIVPSIERTKKALAELG